MRKIIVLLLFFVCTKNFSQKNNYCDIYVQSIKSESIVESIYKCNNKYFLKVKYGEVKDAVLIKQKNNSYLIENLNYMINQKYFDLKKFSNQKYFLFFYKNKVVLEVNDGVKKKIYNYKKLDKKIDVNMLE